MNLILFGFKGCGKSTVGALLAKKLQMPFVDTDLLIEKREKKSCRELFSTLGEEAFRALETEIILGLRDTTHSVIALGGGAVLNNAALLQTLGLLIYLHADKETLRKRCLPSSFLTQENFDAIYEQRKTIYEKIPSLQVEVDKMPLEGIVSWLATRLAPCSESPPGESRTERRSAS